MLMMTTTTTMMIALTNVELKRNHLHDARSLQLGNESFANVTGSFTPTVPLKKYASSIFNLQAQANYTPLSIKGLAIIGWPYYFPSFSQGSNITLTYFLEANHSYIGFLFGDYLHEKIDLDLWLITTNITSNETQLLEFTPEHDLGKQDILQFTVTETGNYTLVIYNHVSQEEFSLVGFILLEEMSGNKDSFEMESPIILPLEEIPRYHTYRGIFIPWKEDYQDVNMTIQFTFTDSTMQLNASIYRAFTPDDLLRYDPFLPAASRHSDDFKTIDMKNTMNRLSLLLGPKEKGWMTFPGLIVFMEAIEGNGTVTLSVNTTTQFDIQYTTPIGVPQYLILNQTSFFASISYYLDKREKYDILSWLISPSPEENNPVTTLEETITVQAWQGSALEAESNFLDPRKVPLLSKETTTTPTIHITSFNPPKSGRYTFIVYINAKTNISKQHILVFNILERWDMTSRPTREAIIEGRNKWNPLDYGLQSFKVFFIPVSQWKGKNVTFHLTVPETLEIEVGLHPFTTMRDQLQFNPFSHDHAITWKKGANEELTVFSEVGRRNKDKINDTFWVLSIIGLAGKGTIQISWTITDVPINWTDLTITGTIVLACLVIIITVAWKGEEYFHSI